MKCAWQALALAAALRGAPLDAEDPPSLRLLLSSRKVEVFERVEIRVEGVPAAENPFDPELISLELTATTPTGAVLKVPGYYGRDFERRLEEGREVLAPKGEVGWRIRYLPSEPGRHSLSVAAAVPGREPIVAVTRLEVAPGRRHGLARIDAASRRYFRLDDGTPLFLLGLCASWPDGRGTFDCDERFAAYEKAGINYVRLWMWPEAFGIEWDRGDRLRYRLDRAWALERVLEEAERRGIYVLLCLDYHGILEVKPDFWGGNNHWPRHPYNAANGGPAKDQNEFFTSEGARALYRKRLRYLVGRYGAFPNLLAWELFNEIDNVYPYLKHGDVVDWHRDLARYLRSIDPWRHPITSSLTGQSERRELWELPEMDFAQYHSYNELHPAELQAAKAERFHARYRKPFLLGEYGTDFRGWKPDDDPHLRALHQAIWSGPFTGAAGTGMSWWWQEIHRAGIYEHWSSLAAFLKGTPVAASDMAPLVCTVEERAGLKTFAVGSSRAALLWLLDAAYDWPDGAKEAEPAVKSGAVVTLPGLEDGPYRIEWWDPLGGKIIAGLEAESRSGRLRLEAPPFRADVAARIIRR